MNANVHEKSYHDDEMKVVANWMRDEYVKHDCFEPSFCRCIIHLTTQPFMHMWWLFIRISHTCRTFWL